ncbi:MAG TPA: hypothetical protein DIC60_07495 [Lachnospiraceae bacterium]|nr:hypothetical protein [Lachnospiraceae bacterium]
MADFILYLTGIINNLGYWGILGTTGLEYACFPVSSELLLPFIGYSVYMGRLNLPLAVLSSTIGGVVGCSFCYGAGRFGRGVMDKIFVKRFSSIGQGINKAENYFINAGKQSVFFGRLMPIVRTYISFPAGMAKMNYLTFLGFSAAGALIWNTFLISLGYFMGEHWEQITILFENNKVGISLIVLMLIGIIWINKKKK